MAILSDKMKLIAAGIFFILFMLFYLVILPFFDVSDLSKGIYSLDVRSSYSPEYVYLLFHTIGEVGLQQYIYFIFADFGYIFVYGILAFLMLSILTDKMGRLGTILKFTVFAPVLLMAADVIENINTFFLIMNSENLSYFWIRFGSVVSTTKWFLASVVIGMIICYIFYATLRFALWKSRIFKK